MIIQVIIMSSLTNDASPSLDALEYILHKTMNETHNNKRNTLNVYQKSRSPWYLIVSL